MKLNLYIFLFFSFVPVIVFGQRSAIILSGLKVTAMIDASTESNGFFVEMNVSDPANLFRLEILIEDGNNMANTTRSLYHIQHNGNKVELVFDKYAIPFEGQKVRFFVKVRDQLRSPYHKMVIEGYDKNNLITNLLVYNQLN